jgi:hypothetical protein
MLIKEIRETADVGLDSVDPVGISEVSESHSQPPFNEELYDFAQQWTECHILYTCKITTATGYQPICS